MKILIVLATLLALALPSVAQFERSVPIVSVNNPALIQHREAPAPNFGTAMGNRTLAIDPTLFTRLQHALDSLHAKTSVYGKHGVAAAVIVPGMPVWTGSSGESYPGAPLSPDHLFEIASNTKTFTTAFIMQLAEEGKLSLTDSLWKWLPSYNNIDSNITIRQLLEHSSGIYDYLNDDPLGTILIDAYFYTPDKVWTPEEILTHFIGKPNFLPGKSYKYSNTNFLLLGLIAEKAAGTEFDAGVRSRFINLLNLSRTFIGWKDSLEGEFANNWFDTGAYEPMMDLGSIPKTAQLSMAHAAGGMVSVPGDLASWVKVLHEGTLLTTQSRTEMRKLHTWPDGTRYGLGTLRVPYGNKSFYGHTGGLLGFYSDMFNNPIDSVTFVIYLNSSSFQGDVGINDYAIAILNEIYKPAASVGNDAPFALKVGVSPNPSISKATIRYELPQAGKIRLAVYNSLGNEVVVLADGEQVAGEHSIYFDASKHSAGIYTYQLSTTTGIATGKLAVVN